MIVEGFVSEQVFIFFGEGLIVICVFIALKNSKSFAYTAYKIMITADSVPNKARLTGRVFHADLLQGNGPTVFDFLENLQLQT